MIDQGSNPRVVPLEGACNFRDLGGYSTADGGRVGCRRLFRSDELTHLTVGDLFQLERMQLRTELDLRWPKERRRAPSKLRNAVDRSVHIPIGVPPQEEFRPSLDRVLAGEIVDVTTNDIGQFYIKTTEEFTDEIGAILSILTTPERRPAVFFCRAGKDRTGIVAMVILGVLGVARSSLLADYIASNRTWGARWSSHFEQIVSACGRDFERVRLLFEAPVAAAEMLLDHFEDEYGSIEGFARQRLGLTSSAIEALREDMLDASD